MPLHLVGRDPLGGPAAVWLDTDSGDLIIKGLTSIPDELQGRPVPDGRASLTLPDRMKPIILEALDLARILGLGADHQSVQELRQVLRECLGRQHLRRLRPPTSMPFVRL